MPGDFASLRAEVETYSEDVLRMYRIEEMMLKSDFGRANPKRVHELARHSVGISDHIKLGRTPLAEWQNDLEF